MVGVWDLEGVWIPRNLASTFWSCVFFVFFFFFLFCPKIFTFGGQNILLWVLFMHCTYTIHILKNIKNGSHDTIHTFKNYFTIVFSVFSFNNNKLNPNRPLIHKGKDNCYVRNIYPILLQCSCCYWPS